MATGQASADSAEIIAGEVCSPALCGREGLAKCLWFIGCYCLHTNATLFPAGPWLRSKVPKCSRAEKPQRTPKDWSKRGTECERLSCSL